MSLSAEKGKAVDFVFAWLHGLRALRIHEQRGKLDSLDYLYISQDILAAIDEVTQTLVTVL